MEEFKVNNFITLRLEGKDTVIYVAGNRFQQCKYLLLNIPIDKVSTFDEIDSIDEAAEKLDKSLEPITSPLEDYYTFDIPPKTGFWAHCSNLQVWNENSYNTRLLHSNLAFPLLKKLTEVGDKQALKVFKEEIAKRIESAYEPVIQFLWKKGYIRYLKNNEISSLSNSISYELKTVLDIESLIKRKFILAESPNEVDDEQTWFSIKNGKIKELEISYLPELESFPYLITNLKHLSILRMIENSIKNIPDSIGNLNSLIHLDLRINNIDKIPKMISRCTRLKRFELYGNLLKNIPQSIGNLISLEELNLGLNNISIIPDSIGNLTKLKKLELGNNNLKRLPSSIEKLQSLEYLSLRLNKLTNALDYISSLKGLKVLLIDGNNISYIPENLQLNYLQIDQTQSEKFNDLLPKLEKKGVKIKILKNQNLI